MLRKDEDGRYPLSGAEYAELQTVIGLVDALGRLDAINDRLGLIRYGKRDLGCIRAKANKLFEKLLLTVPNKKLRMIKQELSRTYCEVKLHGAAGQAWDNLCIVPMDALTAIMNKAIEQSCYLCSKDAKAGKRCDLYKMLCACLPYAPEQRKDGACPLAGSFELEDRRLENDRQNADG